MELSPHEGQSRVTTDETAPMAVYEAYDDIWSTEAVLSVGARMPVA